MGRIGIGKVENGSLKINQDAVVVNHHNPDRREKVRISKLYEFDGLKKVDVTEANIGSIVAISGIADLHIGDTICAPEDPQAIPFQKISEPTISMNFMVNDSPFAGQEGKYVTSRHIRDRLFREPEHRRIPAGGGDRFPGLLQGVRPWRAASLRPDREHAAGRFRICRVQGGGTLPHR